MDTICSEYENGTALHIAATNLGVSAVQVLLNFGADANLTDDLARKPHDCIPEMHAIDVTLPIDDVEEMITKLQHLLQPKRSSTNPNLNEDLLIEQSSMGLSSLSINTKGNGITTGRSVMNALRLKVIYFLGMEGRRLASQFLWSIDKGLLLLANKEKNFLGASLAATYAFSRMLLVLVKSQWGKS